MGLVWGSGPWLAALTRPQVVCAVLLQFASPIALNTAWHLVADRGRAKLESAAGCHHSWYALSPSLSEVLSVRRLSVYSPRTIPQSHPLFAVSSATLAPSPPPPYRCIYGDCKIISLHLIFSLVMVRMLRSLSKRPPEWRP